MSECTFVCIFPPRACAPLSLSPQPLHLKSHVQQLTPLIRSINRYGQVEVFDCLLKVIPDTFAIEDGLERDERDPNEVGGSTSRSGKRKHPVIQLDDDEGAEAGVRSITVNHVRVPDQAEARAVVSEHDMRDQALFKAAKLRYIFIYVYFCAVIVSGTTTCSNALVTCIVF